MNMLRCSLLVLVSGSVLAGVTLSQEKTTQKEPAKKPEERRHVMNFNDMPWKQVIDWYRELSGLPYNASISAPPTGSFSFTAPKGQTFTLSEITDYLNEALNREKYALIRKPRSFTIVPADQSPDPADVDRILPEELERWGNFDLVSVVVPLKSIIAEYFAPEVKKMMSSLGQVSYLSGPNQLVLMDRVKTLKTIIEVIKKTDTDDTSASQLAHKCVYVLARDAAQILQNQLGDITKLVTLMQGGPQFRPGGGDGDRFGG